MADTGLRLLDEKKTKDQLIQEIQSLRKKVESRDQKDEESRQLAEERTVMDKYSRAILDSLNTNIAVIDETGTIVDVNKCWLNFARDNGVTSLDNVGIGVNYFEVCEKASGYNYEEAQNALSGLLSIIDGKRGDFSLEYPCDSPEVRRWFLMYAVPFNMDEHRYILVNHINITQRKMAEEALQKANDELELRVKERSGELENVNKVLQNEILEHERDEEALRETKSDAELYLDLMGHDINNINQIAMGYLELALNTLDYEGYLDKSNRELLAKSYDNLQNASKLISNVKKIRIEKSGQYTPKPYALGQVLSIIQERYSSIPGRDISINFEHGAKCSIMANELIYDVFSNIVGNSVKHSSGPLAIDIKLNRVDVDGKLFCIVDIQDNGPGIPDSQKKQLFGHSCLARIKKAGRGFGLCLVYTLVNDFGGYIWAEDRVKGDYTRGVRFILRFPAI